MGKAAPCRHPDVVRLLVTGQVIAMNPASSVQGPRYSTKKGKTPVLAADEARTLLDSIDTNTHIGLRDCALIGLMVYTFARVGAAFGMRVENVYVQGRRTWVRWHEKGGKRHEMPCHHNLDEYLYAYINGAELLRPRASYFLPLLAAPLNSLIDRCDYSAISLAAIFYS